MSETIGQRVRRLRILAGLSQRELQTERVSYAYLSRIENEQRVPSVKALRELAPKLGVSVHYLETGDEDPLWTAWRVIDDLLRERDRTLRTIRRLRRDLDQAEKRVRHQAGLDFDLIQAVREAAERAINHREEATR